MSLDLIDLILLVDKETEASLKAQPKLYPGSNSKTKLLQLFFDHIQTEEININPCHRKTLNLDGNWQFLKKNDMTSSLNVLETI